MTSIPLSTKTSRSTWIKNFAGSSTEIDRVNLGLFIGISLNVTGTKN